MKNFNYLSQNLEKLQSQKKKFNSINDISLVQFIKFKKLVSKEKKISKQMENAISQGNEINFWYDSQTKSWIENPNINCRKYYKMEQTAAYKKNLTLYKLGLSSQRPIPPLIQNIRNHLSPINNFIKEKHLKIKPILSKFNYFKKIHKNYNYFKSETLPKNINKLAINTATIGIKGYRHLKSNYRFIKNSVTSKNSFKYIKIVILEANKQIDSQEKQYGFRESLKVENFVSNHNSNYIKKKKSPYSISQKNNNKIYEYNLSR